MVVQCEPPTILFYAVQYFIYMIEHAPRAGRGGGLILFAPMIFVLEAGHSKATAP